MITPIPLLPVDPEWKCHGSGDCCTQPPAVHMTKAEQASVMLAASTLAPDALLLWLPTNTPAFVALQAQPCPLFDATTKQCRIYAFRPYNCRRFACMRPDPATEPLRLHHKTGECLNWLIRVKQSRPARRLYQRIQNRAMGWAQSHGWTA